MVQLRRSSLLFVLALGDVVFALSTSSLAEVANSLTPAHEGALSQRRRSGRMRIDQWLAARRTHITRNNATRTSRSTSSDSTSEKDSDTKTETSILNSEEVIDSSGSLPKNRRNKYWPVSTEERKGWRKWHRKCQPCPEVLHKQWKDPSIEWICGAYQRARRTFKSECMMRHRNCQDGTMFVKIHDHRCKDDETGRFGAHFFYEYDLRSTEESYDYGVNVEEELDTYEEARRALKRRAGVSVPSVRTTNSSVAMDLRHASNNVTTTNVNMRLTKVVNITSKILKIKRYSRKVRGGNARRITSNITSAYYRNKVVKDFATHIHHSSRSAKLKSVANVTRRMYSYNGGLDKAIRAVSNFGLSLLQFTAHYSNVGHTQLAVQYLKPQKNEQNRTVTDHVKSTSPNLSSLLTTLVHNYSSSPSQL